MQTDINHEENDNNESMENTDNENSREGGVSNSGDNLQFGLDAALIKQSEYFDAEYYVERNAVDLGGQDPVAHYLLVGEAAGLAPSASFSPVSYLENNPDIAEANTSPLLHFIRYGVAENRNASPRNQEFSDSKLAAGAAEGRGRQEEDASPPTDDEILMSQILASKYFDASYYIASNNLEIPSTDALKHYFEIGERQGFKPSPWFSPKYYMAVNEDVRNYGQSPLKHFVSNGKAEGRLGTAFESIIQKLQGVDQDRPTILLLTHETSATGAPILAFNILEQLKVLFGYNVIVLSWRGAGALAKAFDKTADVFIAPEHDRHYSEEELREAADLITGACKVSYAIGNSAVVNNIALLFQARSIPVIGLVHEFSSLLGDPKMSEYFDKLTELVFPADVVRKSIIKDHPNVGRRTSHIIPQGRSYVPSLGMGVLARDRPFGSDYLAPAVLRWAIEEDMYIVAGLGTLEWRKGLDIFISSASTFKSLNPSFKCKFVWIGGYHSGSFESSMYAEEQIARSGLSDMVLFLPPTKDIEDIYPMLDVLLVVPRLDPFPNVAIDAMCQGIPVIVTEGGTGIAEVLKSDPSTADLVMPYMDSNAVGNKLFELLSDRVALDACGEKVRKFAEGQFDMKDYVLRINDLMSVHVLH